MVGFEIDGYISRRVKENLHHILLERNLLIAAVMTRMKTQIMGYQ